MLTLTDSQWLALQQADARHFVIGVANHFLMDRSEMLDQPGRSVVIEHMRAAHHYADSLRFTSTPHIVRLMYLAADAPRIHDDPLVDAHLRKPGAMPEQRLDDLLAVINKKLETAR